MRFILGLSLPVFLALVSAPAAASTFADAEVRAVCEAMIPRDVLTVQTNEGPISYRYNQSSDDMTQAVRALKPITHRVAGLTSYKFDYALKLAPQFASVPVDGRYCYRIGANLNLAKSPIVVSVATDYSASKCSHDAILEHEMKHVQVYQSFMRYFSREFKRLFADELNTVRLTTQAAGVEEEVNRIVAPAMRQYIETALQRIQVINEEVDSPEEYDRIRTACSGNSMLSKK